jgi:hypothetical protein
MSITLAGAQTAPDTWQFTVAGLDPAESPTFTISYGDSTAPVVVTTHASGTTVVTHTYTTPGHHTYTVTVTAAKTPYALTLQALDDRHAGPRESMFSDLAVPGGGEYVNELGEVFTVHVPGRIPAARVGKSVGSVITTRQVALWRRSDGVKLAVADSVESASGVWVETPFPAPVNVAPGDYIVSYHGADFVSALANPSTDVAPSLTPVSGSLGGLAGEVMPDQLQPYMYYADVVFVADGALADIAADVATLADIAATTQTAAGLTVTVDVGPATIWATVLPGNPVPVVQVDTYIGNIGNVTTWSVARDQPNQSAPIYIGSRLTEAISFIDELAPLGVPITYRLTITYLDGSGAIVTSNTVMIVGTAGCYLTNPATGATLRVTLARWPDRARAPRRALLQVLGRPDPVALSDVHATPAGKWTLYTATDIETSALVTLLIGLGATVVLRTQPGSSIPACTASIGQVTETRYSDQGGDQRRWIDVEIQEIEPLPATALPLAATLGGLADLGATLADLNALRATLLQLSMIPTGEEAPVAANV